VAPSIRKKLAITSLTSGGSSVGIVRSRTQTMVFSFSVFTYFCIRRSELNGIFNLKKKLSVFPFVKLKAQSYIRAYRVSCISCLLYKRDAFLEVSLFAFNG
jgi:hypothetical protein